MKRVFILAVMALVLAACGGGGADPSDDTSAGATSQGVTSTTGAEAPGATEAPSDGGAAPATTPTVPDAGDLEEFLGEGVATARIDGETYYFGDAGFPALQCLPDFFGVMLGFLQMVDEDGNAVGGAGSIQFALLREGTDPDVVDQTNEFVLQTEAGDVDQEWTADESRYDDRDILPGSSEVTSVTFNGNTVTGTANVYDDEAYWGAGGDPEAVPTATVEFEITCADG
jgi:hypothetical protein